VKSNYKLLIAMLAGVLVGAGANAAAQGQQLNTMQNSAPIYCVSEVNTVTDTDALKSYRAKVGDTLAPFNGHYHFIIRSSNVENIEAMLHQWALPSSHGIAWTTRSPGTIRRPTLQYDRRFKLLRRAVVRLSFKASNRSPKRSRAPAGKM
jgi:hypothetical protein